MITLAIRKTCSTKNKLYKCYLKKPTENNHHKYKRYRNLINKVCMKAQTLYYQEILLNTKHSVKKLWQTFAPIINPTKNKNKGSKITQINFNNEIISDKLSMANCFNN